MTKKTTKKKTTKKLVKKVKAVATKPLVKASKKRGQPIKQVAAIGIMPVAFEIGSPWSTNITLSEEDVRNYLQKSSYDANGTFLEPEVPPMTVSEEKQLEDYLENLKKDRLVLANSNKSWLTKVWEFLAELFPTW